MKKGKPPIGWTFFGIAVLALLAVALTAGVARTAATRPVLNRADVITIDTASAFGKLERPAVRFFHGKHTDMMQKRGEDCSVCHLKADNCIACHRETLEKGEKSGL